MKSSEIHNGLPEKEIRDFFAKSMSEMFDKECANKKVEIPYDKTNSFDWSIKNDEAQIVVLKRSIELAHQKIALHGLLNDKGWEEHDISDFTINDSGFKIHLSFIGTTEEYENIMLKLEEEKENL
jgi:hypothetical protein